MLDWRWLYWRNLRDWIIPRIFIFISSLILFCLYLWIKQNLSLSGADEGLFTEIIGILITVFLIDRLRDLNEKNRYRKNLIRQARSKSNSNAIDAIEIIRDEGWLEKKSIRLLSRKNLSEADLTGANLKKAYLHRTRLNKAKLNEGDMRDSILTKAEFQGAELRGTRFAGADLSGANFSKAFLEMCQFKIDLETPDERDAKLRDREKVAIFEESTLKSISFRDMDLHNMSFKNCHIENVIFDWAHLTEVKFYDVRFIKTSFFKSNLERAEFSEHLKAANTSDIISFESANLQSAHLENCYFNNTRFTETDLAGAYCTGATFRGCNLHSAIFTGAILGNVLFIKVEFNGMTKLPSGNTLKSIWDECINDHDNQDIESQFKQQILAYFLEEVGIKGITDSFFVYEKTPGSEPVKIPLDSKEFLSFPKTDLPESDLDKLSSADELYA